MENSDPQKQITDKLLKLIEKERSARDIGSLEEAETFATKVQELCTKYNIELSKIKGAEPPKFVKAIVKTGAFTKRNESDWVVNLGCIIFDVYGCYPLILRGSGMNHASGEDDLLVSGFEHDIAAGSYMVEAMSNRIREISRKEYKLRRDDYPNPNTFYRHFFQGAVVALRIKFSKKTDEMTKEHGEEYGLMVLDKKLALKEFATEGKPIKTMALGNNFSDLKNSQAFGRGFEVGNQQSLTKGVEGRN